MRPTLASRVDAVRRFNRLYTREIGALQEGYLESPFSLTEVRVLYELSHRGRATARELSRDLSLDEGHLSRLLARLRAKGLVARQASEADRRQGVLSLTTAGRRAFAGLDARARDAVAAMLARLPPAGQERLVGAMRSIGSLLAPDATPAPLVLRDRRPGDLGWVVERHGALYAQELGWGAAFETLVARIVADFAEDHDPGRERCWIAERDGERLGCVFLVRKSDRVAKLRLLLVEPAARGTGLGTRLVDECVRFARAAGYRKVTLWTNDVLGSARRIYERAGFECVERKRHDMFGKGLVGETWELRL